MTASTVFAPDLGPAVESIVARDLARRAGMVAPLFLLAGGIAGGVDGVISAAIGIALILANFLVAASLLAWAARISLALVMGVSLFGFLVRLGALTAVFYALRNQDFIHLATLGLTLIVTHVGLLVWELKYVSATLAHPALVPSAPATPKEK